MDDNIAIEMVQSCCRRLLLAVMGFQLQVQQLSLQISCRQFIRTK